MPIRQPRRAQPKPTAVVDDPHEPTWADVLPLQPLEQEMTRNLIYHVYPVRYTDFWQLQIERLIRSWPKFNGRKLVGIVYDDQTVEVETVQALFPKDVEYIIQRNDYYEGELVTFRESTRRLQSTEPWEITFYAHGKGVSPQYHRPEQNSILASIQRWTEFMYQFTLELPNDWIDNVLSRWPCGGSLKKHVLFFCRLPRKPEHKRQTKQPQPCRWHYSGTFFWFNHAYYFTHPDAFCFSFDRWAVERHLGEMFPVQDAFCFAGNLGKEIDLGKQPPSFWDALIAEAERQLPFQVTPQTSEP